MGRDWCVLLGSDYGSWQLSFANNTDSGVNGPDPPVPMVGQYKHRQQRTALQLCT
jgi:hypothetical protein